MKTWGKTIIGGLLWKVRVVDGLECGSDGEADYERQLITVRRHPEAPSRTYDTVFHELFHAVADATGLRSYLASVIKNPRQVEKVEEQIIRMLVPGIIPALRGLGLLSRKVVK